MTEMVMPRLSDTMEEGTILRWLKADGEHVARGEELVEIETDKANMTYESDQEGTLRIVAQEGDTLAVGQTIAHIGEGGDGEVPPPAPRPEQPEPAHAKPAKAEPEKAQPAPGERIKASPVARRVAKENDVDLQKLSGTGPGGRIVKADVEAAGEASPASGAEKAGTDSIAPPASVEGVTAAKGETSVQELSRTQRTIARRMAESKATIPDFTLNMDVDMEECVALRTQLKELAQPNAPTYNDMVVKASALALREFPRANGSYRDGSFELHSRVNVGVAVATEDALVVPTVFDADTKSLGEIARETRALAERVRDATITPPELGGGTFTVSNLGMFGVTSFTAIINPPQAAILSVGALGPRAIVLAGGPNGGSEIVARHTMSLTLACDHRILYGADAANFLARIRELLQAPASLTL
ncbi:MAG TPA: dihydrolipoamide acetyltransferase family protein [Solirubrobacteraceae bacterium]|jgi:pyruvate dehydrogenase E2 component (dihydrolipoamide acetyltransferase)